MHSRMLLLIVTALGLASFTACSSNPGPSPSQRVSSQGSSALPTSATSAFATPTGNANGAGIKATCTVLSQNTRLLTDAANGNTADLRQQIATMRELATNAPAEIRVDIKLVADFDQDVVTEIDSGRSQQISETPAVTSALKNTVVWIATHCS